MKSEIKPQRPVAGPFALAVVAAVSAAGSIAAHAAEASGTWLDQTISPVSNPIYFEDPHITSEVRPIFMYHSLPSTFDFSGGSAPLGGHVEVYAVQLRYALTERLGLIATKDGYIAMKPDHTLGHSYGWADLAAGLKYAVFDDREHEWIVTPGFTFEVPTGNTDVQQGRGSGEWNLFVSGEKGIQNFHVIGNVGFRIPNDFNENTSQAHYSLQLDYRVCQYFVPFFAVNAYTILSDGDHKLLNAVNLNTEMYDLINFGSTDAKGTTQTTVGGGLRSRVLSALDIGFAYEAGVSDPVGIFENRVTVDVIWRF